MTAVDTPTRPRRPEAPAVATQRLVRPTRRSHHTPLDPFLPAPGSWARPLVAVTWLGLGALVAVGVVLRFWTRSDLWLDETQTVNIARLPLGQMHGALMRDGSPPLYYLLLHLWMKVFGTSNLGVRSLSGVIGVATLPLAWLAGRRLGDRRVAAAVVVLLATSPYATYYSTEVRMYALVALLTTVGFCVLDSVLRRPRPGALVGLALVTAALLYTHYWALYLVAATALWLAWTGWRGTPQRRHPARLALVSMACGAVAFVPWVPTLLYQLHHTGTPWAASFNLVGMINAASSFASDQGGPALAVVYGALALLGINGAAKDGARIELDLRARTPTRALALVIVGTLALAITGGYFSNSAFVPRYAMVAFVPLLLLVAMGFATIADRRAMVAALAATALFGMLASLPNIDSQRSEANLVAHQVSSAGRAGDVVAYCPDQLGPDAARLLPPERYRQITFPRDAPSTLVNWVDYASAIQQASPARFAHRLESMVSPGEHIWYVWNATYRGFGDDCQQIGSILGGDHNLRPDQLVQSEPQFYEQSNLTEYTVMNRSTTLHRLR